MSLPSRTERISVLMACHNRRERTLTCLRSLFGQEDLPDLEVVLVDDGSSDGTAWSVQQQFPAVRVVSGTGDLYWSGGMRLAHRISVQSEHDFLLWLNDDVELGPEALKTMLSTHRDLVGAGHAGAIVVGAVCDPLTHTTTYSAVLRCNSRRPMQFSAVEPGHQAQRCETMHGNLVLVPRAVHELVGNLDPAYTHAISDFDYGLRALRQGCEVWLAPGHLGTCARNRSEGTWLDSDLSARARLEEMCSPRGLPPREWWVFTRRHAGKAWPLFWASPYVRLLARLVVSSARPGRSPGTAPTG